MDCNEIWYALSILKIVCVSDYGLGGGLCALEHMWCVFHHFDGTWRNFTDSYT